MHGLHQWSLNVIASHRHPVWVIGLVALNDGMRRIDAFEAELLLSYCAPTQRQYSSLTKLVRGIAFTQVTEESTAIRESLFSATTRATGYLEYAV